MGNMILAVVLSPGGIIAWQGPAERAGESIDKGFQNAKDAVNPPGAGERVGREVDKALKP